MLIKRCEIDGITVDIKVENGTSTKEEQTLALINLLKFLVEGHIDSLVKNNASKEEVKNYKELLELINNYLEYKQQLQRVRIPLWDSMFLKFRSNPENPYHSY